ncbi:MAG: hypothetical protein ABI520_02450 [Caldimonas sp.]
MIEARSTFSTATLHAWTRLPTSMRLTVAIVAVVGMASLAATALDTPAIVPAKVHSAVGSAPVRDPSVPEASLVLPADDRQQETSIPTF